MSHNFSKRHEVVPIEEHCTLQQEIRRNIDWCGHHLFPATIQYSSHISNLFFDEFLHATSCNYVYKAFISLARDFRGLHHGCLLDWGWCCVAWCRSWCRRHRALACFGTGTCGEPPMKGLPMLSRLFSVLLCSVHLFFFVILRFCLFFDSFVIFCPKSLRRIRACTLFDATPVKVS